MKPQKTAIALLALLFCLAAPSWADDDDHGDEPGFSGMIQAGGMYMHTTSQLEADDDNKRTNSLSSDADGISEIVPAALIELRYRFSTNTEIYLETPFENEGTVEYENGLSFGVAREFGFGTLDVSGFYGFGGEVWEDPYLIRQDRKSTDASVYGASLEYRRIFGTGFTLQYDYREQDVDRDAIGERYASLRRDGSYHSLGGQYSFDMGGGHLLTPGISYVRGNMDGDAQSFDGFETELSYQTIWDNYMLLISAEIGYAKYDADQPVFNKRRKETEYGALGMFIWTDPLGFEDFFVNIGGGFGITDANIDFYDSEDIFTFTTIGYSF